MDLKNSPTFIKVNQINEWVTQSESRLANLVELHSGSIDALSGELDNIEQSLVGEVQQQQDALSAFQTTISEREQELQTNTELTDTIDALQIQIESLGEDLETSIESVATDLAKLTEQSQTLESQLTSAGENASQSIEHFDTQLATSSTGLRETSETLIEHTQGFEQHLQTDLDTTLKNFLPLIQAGETQWTTAASYLESQADSIHKILHTRFSEEITDEIIRISDNINDAISGLQKVSEIGNSPAIKTLDNTMSQVSEALGIIEEIKPVLDTVKEVLG